MSTAARTSGLPGAGPAFVLLDIEGTVGSLSFVRDVLFPYARQRLREFVRARHAEPQIAEQLAATAREAGVAVDDLDAQITALERWSDEDRKATPLKAIQGHIWAQGYASGELRAHLYPDAVAAMRRWHADGRQLHIYSSGSIAAQKLYFKHTGHGDLTALIDGYFDTTTGPKQAPSSYRSIADAIGLAVASGMFLSDAPGEIDAARQAGMGALLVSRDAVPEQKPTAIASFDDAGF